MNHGKEKTTDPTSDYATYLGNEMTIMGILSTFCVVAIGGCITLLANVPKEHGPWLKQFWAEQGVFVLFGLAAVLLSAFFFYRQRSILSYYVGQIYLSMYDPEIADGSVHELHERANNWITWRFYRLAFLCLFTAAAFFARVTLALVVNRAGSFWHLLERMRMWELWAPVVVCILLSVAVCMAVAAFPDGNHPYSESLHNPRRFLRAASFFVKGGLE